MSKRHREKHKAVVNSAQSKITENVMIVTHTPKPIVRPQIPKLELTLSGEDFIATDHTGHSIRIPSTENGLRILKQLLRAKQLTPHKQLGSTAQPTQQMVEAFLRNRKLEEENEQEAILKEF